MLAPDPHLSAVLAIYVYVRGALINRPLTPTKKGKSTPTQPFHQSTFHHNYHPDPQNQNAQGSMSSINSHPIFNAVVHALTNVVN